MKFLTNPLITLSCVFHIHSGAIATSGPVAPRVGLLTPAHLVTVSSPLMSYQGPNVLTPLRRPDGHQSSGSSSGLLMQAAVTPLDPSNRDDLLSGRPARTLINQRTAARIVYNFRQVLLVLLATLCIMSFIVLVWVIVEFVKHENDDCDVPLSLYVKIWLGLWAFGVSKKELQKCILRWAPSDGPRPLRVQILDVIHIGVVHIWVAMGNYWVATSQTCSATSPELFTAVKYWVHLQAVVLLIGTLAILASRFLIQFLQQHSNLSISAHPSLLIGAMEKVKFSTKNPDLLDEKGKVEACSVCQEYFDDVEIIRKTPCGHVFHEKCLAAWCARKPTCPLCRAELGPSVMDIV